MTRHKHHAYESPMPEDEVSARMESGAGRRLQARLAEQGLLDDAPDEQAAATTAP